MKINGIVLAAGYGARLKPLTERIPKPLLPVCGTPIIELALEKLAEAGASRIAVNAYHLAGQIEAYVSKSRLRDRIELFKEPEILGTGGPLVNAKALLSDCDCFILHNGDVVSDFDVKAMLKEHCERGAVVTMAALDGPENRLLVSKDGGILDILGKLGAPSEEGSRMATYACVAIFSPEIFKWLPEKPVPASIIDAILKLMAERPGAARAVSQDGRLWCDIGSFEQYFRVHEELLLKSSGKGFHVPAGASVAGDASLGGFVSASPGSSIGSKARVESCILLPGAKVPPGEFRRNEAIGDGFSVHREWPALAKLEALSGLKPGWTASSLAEQGSDRRFYRLKEEGLPSKILLLSSAKDQDFQRYIAMGAFMHANRLKTPEIFKSVDAEYSILMEDLGDDTLFKLLAEAAPEKEVERLYGAVVDALADFQSRGAEAIEREAFQIRLFDYDYLRWETTYFKENFLELLCGLPIEGAEATELDSELHALASEAFAMPHALLHRDFQSQNILIRDGRPRFVDFQGARIGPYAYDLASLLKDPYVKLPRPMRERLAARHYEKLSGWRRLAGRSLDGHLACLAVCSLQRNMQALGAYGFLSLKKRKGKYLDYAAPCLGLLLESLADAKAGKPEMKLVRLEELCKRAQEAVSSRVAAARESLGLR